MHGSIALPCRANPNQQLPEDRRLVGNPLQTHSLHKQRLYIHQQQEISAYNPSSLRNPSPSRGEYNLRCIAEDRNVTSCYRVNHCPNLDRFSRPMSPISQNFNTSSPFPRSSSRGSSQSYQSSSADDSGREGGASSSGIGLSGSSAMSSRRASSCSSGTGGSKLTYYSSNLIGSGSSDSPHGSLDSCMNLNGSELTVKSVSLRSDRENRSLSHYCDDIMTKSEEDVAIAAKRTQSMDSIESELICPICLDLYHEPVLLPCAHNLCANCAEQLSQSSQTLGQSSDFHCPTCREPVRLDEKGVSVLRHNMTLQNIVDGYRRAAAASVTSQGIATCSDFEMSSGDESSSSNHSNEGRKLIRPKYMHLLGKDLEGEVSCQFCEDEPSRPATKTCTTCKAYYCERCLRLTHPRKKPFINHKLIPATPGSAGTLSNPSSSNRCQPFAFCSNHPQEAASLFCWSCESCLCKVCSSSTVHSKHSVSSVADAVHKEKTELEAKMLEVQKVKKDQERAIDRLMRSCQQTEVHAENQEAKLQAECDALIRIIQGRKAAISNKIIESKTLRIRQLSQKASDAQQRMETCSPALDAAQKALLHSTDFDSLLKRCRPASCRLNEVLSSSSDVLKEDQFIPPGCCFQFSKEKAILEGLDIIEVPTAPKICEELCTQSHDKVTVQWRSPDHDHIKSYELQYTVDNLSTSSTLTPSEMKEENWMIVPKVRDCHYTVHGLQSGTRYVFAVKATNEAGSNRSECCAIKTLGIPFTFDSHSMHKKLRLANHGYTAAREDPGRKSKDVGSSSSLCCVSGSVDIECGKHYWEVVVCQSSSFTIGVAYSDVSRYDWIGKNSNSWCLCRFGDEWSARHAGKDLPINMSLPLPKKIGVLLDYDGASLSYFDGASGRHIHTFKSTSYQRPLRPAFAIGNKSLTINTGITLPDHLRFFDSA